MTEEEDDSDEDSDEESDGENDEDYDDPETGVPLDDSVCPPSKINNQLLREQVSCLHPVVHLCIVRKYLTYITLCTLPFKSLWSVKLAFDFFLINTFIKQGQIKLFKSDSKNI